MKQTGSLFLFLICFLLFSCFAEPAFCETIIDIAADEQDLTVEGGAAYDYLTMEAVMLVADVNVDGIDDLIVSSYYSTPDSKSSAGAVYVYFGGTGLSGVKDIAGTDGATPDVVIRGAAADDNLTRGGRSGSGT